MKNYSIFHVPVWSFFSKALYREAALEWQGTGFAYLLLLLAVCWIALILQVQAKFSRFVDQEAPKLICQIPAFSIVKGKAAIQEPQPYLIKEPKTGETLLVIDTTGSITSLDEAKAFGLITETQAIFRKNKFETRTFSFREIDQFTLDQDKITGWLNVARKSLFAVLYPLAVLASFTARLVQLLIYAAIGLLFASWCKCQLTYPALLRLAAVAVTPGIIIKTILTLAQTHVPGAGWWYFLLAMGFLFFGVKASSQNPAQPAPPPPPIPVN
jgi:hypothetical protein